MRTRMSRACVVSVIVLAAVTVASGCKSKSESDPPRPGEMDAGREPSEDAGSMADASDDDAATRDAGSDAAASEAGSGGTGGQAGGSAGSGGASAGEPLVYSVSRATDVVAPGGRVLFTITVGNVSGRAIDGVTVLLRVPTGLQFLHTSDVEPDAEQCGNTSCTDGEEARWMLGTLAPGASRVITVNSVVLNGATDGSSISTPVRFTATGLNPKLVETTVHVRAAAAPQLVLGSGGDYFAAGERVSLELDVGNGSAMSLTGARLELTLPASVVVHSISDGGTMSGDEIVWSIGDVALGSALQRRVVIGIREDADPGATLLARASFEYDGGPEGGIGAERVLSVDQESSPLTLAFSAAIYPVQSDGALLYRATISNVSSRSVDAVRAVLRVPAGLQFSHSIGAHPDAEQCGNASCTAHEEAIWNLGTLEPGATRSLMMNLEAGALTGGALVTALFEVGRAGSRANRALKAVPIQAMPSARLHLTAANPVRADQELTIALDAGNVGDQTLQGVRMHAYLPQGVSIESLSDGGSEMSADHASWDLGTLALGASARRTVSIKLASSLPSASALAIRAVLIHEGGPPVDASAEHTLWVVESAPPLTLEWTASPSTVSVGNRLQYTATVTNVSGQAVDDIGLVFRVPAELQFNATQDAEPDASSCGNATCTAHEEGSWQLGTMTPGSSQIISINALVASGLAAGTPIAGTARLDATGLTAPIEARLVSSTVP